MHDLPFELKPFFAKHERGRTGMAGCFGEVTVKVEKVPVHKGDGYCTVQVSGELIPTALYRARAIGIARPSLQDANLILNEVPVELQLGKRWLRKKDRVLQLNYENRSYEYKAEGVTTGGVLRRPEMQITCSRKNNTTGKGVSSHITVAGDADAADLALAVVFEEVDTGDLTPVGAALSAFARHRNRLPGESPSE